MIILKLSVSASWEIKDNTGNIHKMSIKPMKRPKLTVWVCVLILSDLAIFSLALSKPNEISKIQPNTENTPKGLTSYLAAVMYKCTAGPWDITEHTSNLKTFNQLVTNKK